MLAWRREIKSVAYSLIGSSGDDVLSSLETGFSTLHKQNHRVSNPRKIDSYNEDVNVKILQI